VRSTLPPEALVAAVAERLRHVDSRLAVSNLRPLTDVVGTAMAGPRFNLLLVGSFALLALALAAIGVYGVVGYLVSQRTRELGIRIALGAQRETCSGRCSKGGMRPVFWAQWSVSLGAVAASHVIRGLLFGVAPLDWSASVAAVPRRCSSRSGGRRSGAARHACGPGRGAARRVATFPSCRRGLGALARLRGPSPPDLDSPARLSPSTARRRRSTTARRRQRTAADVGHASRRGATRPRAHRGGYNHDVTRDLDAAALRGEEISRARAMDPAELLERLRQQLDVLRRLEDTRDQR
jgi:hypothetical protein